MSADVDRREMARLAKEARRLAASRGRLLRLKTVEQLRELNAQDWADFKAHWPMRLVEIASDFCVGTLLGVGLGLAALLQFLHQTA